MERLPDELLGSIFKYTIDDTSQLLILQSVCKKFHRLSNNAYLWYYAYKIMYPTWSFHINYAHQKQPLVDWKYLMLKLYKQRKFIKSNFQLESILSSSPSTKIQEPFISDIDPMTNKGILAISNYNKKETKHEILFYQYPSYQLVRKFQLLFRNHDQYQWTCQIIGIQSLVIHGEKIRIFAISINQPQVMDEDDDHEEEEEPPRDELQNLWKNILIYRLHDNGATTCLANLETSATSSCLGRGSYFFNTLNGIMIEKWLQIISPDTLDDYDPAYSIFMLTYGLSLTRFTGYSRIIQFDIRTNLMDDPSHILYHYCDQMNKFCIVDEPAYFIKPSTTASAKMMATHYLGASVSCMIHFRNPPELNHLIITGNFLRDELTIYDWRFGLNVGLFPPPQQDENDSTRRQQQHMDSVQPWGFESGWAIPPPPPSPIVDYLLYGPRLIVVGDYQDKFEIKIWDISQLLKVTWDPLKNDGEQTVVMMNAVDQQDAEDQAVVYLDWWDRKTNQLKQVAMAGYLDRVDELPYTMSQDAVKRVHLLDAQIKYTAYISLHTWLYLLHEDGHLSVMDIESGEILVTVNTHGIAEDVNVVGDNEIIITRKEALSRSLLP